MVAKPRRVWASEKCGAQASSQLQILCGHGSAIRYCLMRAKGRQCAHCLRTCGRTKNPLHVQEWRGTPFYQSLSRALVRFGFVKLPWQADHIVPVMFGGGGLDLKNFQVLCHVCHATKSNAMRLRPSLRARARIKSLRACGDYEGLVRFVQQLHPSVRL